MEKAEVIIELNQFLVSGQGQEASGRDPESKRSGGASGMPATGGPMSGPGHSGAGLTILRENDPRVTDEVAARYTAISEDQDQQKRVADTTTLLQDIGVLMRDR